MQLTKQWNVYPAINSEQSSKLNGYPPIVAQLLYNRGLIDAVSAKKFFSLDWQLDAHDPFAFKDMTLAVDLLVKHLKNKNLIAVVGDYDADGVTASAVVAEVIKAINGRVDVWIPSRLGEGYGLSKKIIDQVVAAGAGLLITVDNGVRAASEVAYAKQKGLEVIVTDHHLSPEQIDDLPEPPLLDPILARDTYPFKYLAGVGVAFKLMAALLANSKLSAEQQSRLLIRILDLVALGTVADCVPLIGENRALVKKGLVELAKQRRPGIRALIAKTQLKGVLSEWHVGWQLAPRLNVAGRLDHANTALDLLMTVDQQTAEALAEKLNNQNAQRQGETVRIVEQCEKLIEEKLSADRLLIVTSPDLGDAQADRWLEGVIGLVAGRLCEKYARPVLVICQSEGQIKGSGRSVEGFDVVDFLGNFKHLLLRYGGHKMACGFTVKNKESLAELVSAARALAQQQLTEEVLRPSLKIDAVLDLRQLTPELIDWLDKFAPFGQANPMPLFLSEGVRLQDLLPLGGEGQHYKMRFGSVWAVAWHAAKRWPDLTLGQVLDIVYTAEWNEFNGYKSLQLKIVDLKIKT